MSNAEELVGKTLNGKYLLLSLLGEGGMGVVLEGRNTEINKRVAIKLINHQHALSGELAARLLREARACGSIESESIVQVFDVGQDPEVGVYMVMELLSGEDLQQRLEREGKLDIPTAIHIAYRVARALTRAHALGVVHRDLKPANIFLARKDDGTEQVKILDFGISKLLMEDASHAAKPGLTRIGSVVGTPHYMSPEQAQGLSTIDHRTDLWSLGGLLYEMLTGRPAYDELPTYEQTILRVLTTKPAPIATLAPWVPPSLAAIIEQALEHDLDRRIPDADTFANYLQSLLAPGTTDTFQAVQGGGAVAKPALLRIDSGKQVAIAPVTGGQLHFVAPAAPMAPPLPGLSADFALKATLPENAKRTTRAHTTNGAIAVPDHDAAGAPSVRRRASMQLWASILLLMGLGSALGAFFAVRSLRSNPTPGAATAPEQHRAAADKTTSAKVTSIGEENAPAASPPPLRSAPAAKAAVASAAALSAAAPPSAAPSTSGASATSQAASSAATLATKNKAKGRVPTNGASKAPTTTKASGNVGAPNAGQFGGSGLSTDY